MFIFCNSIHITFQKRQNCGEKAGQWLPGPVVEGPQGSLGNGGKVLYLHGSGVSTSIYTCHMSQTQLSN